MHLNLEPYEKLVKEKFLNKNEMGDLVLYNYTNDCTFNKEWNEYTLQSRGLIFNKETGEVIARPLKKFFNLFELPDTQLNVLPDIPYKVFDKVDGSCGIFFWYNDKPRIATRGSFYSDQAIEATKMLQKYDLETLDRDLTLIFEIIYPENTVNPTGRLVVDYGIFRDLILLTVNNRKTNEELTRKEVAKISETYGFPLVEECKYSIDELIKLQETLPATKEGWVVRFDNGFRIKIKGKEYLEKFKLLNFYTPLNVWKALEKGKFPRDKVKDIPEEIRDGILDIANKLEDSYSQILQEIKDDCQKAPKPTDQDDRAYKKTVAFWLRDNKKNLNHPDTFFNAFFKKDSDRYIKKVIKNYLYTI